MPNQKYWALCKRRYQSIGNQCGKRLAKKSLENLEKIYWSGSMRNWVCIKKGPLSVLHKKHNQSIINNLSSIVVLSLNKTCVTILITHFMWPIKPRISRLMSRMIAMMTLKIMLMLLLVSSRNQHSLLD